MFNFQYKQLWRWHIWYQWTESIHVNNTDYQNYNSRRTKKWKILVNRMPMRSEYNGCRNTKCNTECNTCNTWDRSKTRRHWKPSAPVFFKSMWMIFAIFAIHKMVVATTLAPSPPLSLQSLDSRLISMAITCKTF